MAIGSSFVLTGTAPHTQLNTGGGSAVQTLTLDPDCRAVVLSGAGTGTNIAFVTFDNTTPTATNGISVLAAAQPVTLPIGYYSHGSHNLKVQGSAASTVLNVMQLK
jgi:hypothetical protein